MRRKFLVSAVSGALMGCAAGAFGQTASVATVVAIQPPALLQIEQTVSGAVTSAATTPLSQALTTGFTNVSTQLNQVAAAVSAASKVQTQSSADVASEMDARNVETQKNAMKSQVQMSLEPARAACAAKTVAAYQQSVTEFAAAMRKATIKQAGGGNAPAPGDQALKANLDHNGSYCDPKTAPGGKCEGNQGYTNPAPTSRSGENLAGADVKAGESLMSDQLTLDDLQYKAGEAYIHNTIHTGSEPRILTQKEANTAEGQKYEGLRQVYLARKSMSETVLFGQLAMRKPLPNGGALLNAMNAGSSQSNFLTNAINKVRDLTQTGEPSQLEVMNLEVRRRYEDPDWYTAVNTMGTDALLKEQTMMMALMLKLDYERYRQGEVQAALAAQQASEQVNQSMGPLLGQAEQAMLRGNSKANGQ